MIKKISWIVLFLSIAISIILLTLFWPKESQYAYGWGDSNGGRPSYTIDQINSGILGNKVVFNSIKDSVIGDEKNFVAAIEYEPGKNYAGVPGNANRIRVENRKEYLIRLYAHNNSPNGEIATSENTRVSFSIPTATDKEVHVHGYIYSDNADPKEYWDYITFYADNAFHLEYIYGSALLANNGIGAGDGIALSDEIVTKATEHGVQIGYDALDGRVPGCYEYANYVSIRVKVVFDDDYLIDQQVRLEGTKEWTNYVEAEIGDRVEFQTEYRNLNSNGEVQNNVMLRAILPKNLRYVANTTRIWNINHTGDAVIPDGDIVGHGVNIGSYDPGANAFVRFTAEVVDEDLAPGSNTLVNWVQGSVGDIAIQDYAGVVLYKD